ncbi:peptidoglycan-binding domain-containing protein [Streptomyces sp. NPDC046712]|uniref:peptidoglycan-binding domain-containing protein n=1 Tax=Streptomyces sp. NPDC046712 TaxID=3154802 RepID=UPI0033ECF098
MALGPAGRRRAGLLTAAATALLSLGGVLGSTLVKSPAQAVADSAPPTPTVITTPVERQKLVRTLVFRGDFATGRQTEIAPTAIAATGKDAAQGESAARSSLVVTKVLVAEGDRARAGRPLAEVSGRPVFVLPGALPSYRDLLPGMSGDDVDQLQEALAGLGIGRGGDRSGYFGPGTKSAVAALYRRMGYEPPVTGARTEEAVRQARTAWEEASATVTQLEQGTPAGPDGAATEKRTDDGGSAAGSGTGTGPGTGLDGARKRLAEAKKAYDLAVAADGVMLPASEAIFVKDLPARVSGLPAAVGDRLEGPVVVLTSGGPRLTGYLDPALEGRLTPGTRVEVTSETLGITVSGKVASIGERVTPGDSKDAKGQGQGGQGKSQSEGAAASANGNAPYLPVTITPDKAWDDRLEGHNVMITVTSALTGTAVLVVPQAALLTGADTHTTVTVQEPGGRERKVRVTAGPSADGLVQVTPAGGETLRQGDRVVVGR